MTTDPRALIADGRKHDEAMTPAPWYGRIRFVSRVPGNTGMGATLHANHIANAADREDAAGIAWLRTNLAALIEGYASALDEVELAQGFVREAEHVKFVIRMQDQEMDRLRTSLAEQELMIKQQDRDLERVRADLTAARDMNRHYERERDAWPAAYKQRAAQTDARIKELEAGLREALSLADVPERNQDDEWYAHCESLNAILDQGAPCTTK